MKVSASSPPASPAASRSPSRPRPGWPAHAERPVVAVEVGTNDFDVYEPGADLAGATLVEVACASSAWSSGARATWTRTGWTVRVRSRSRASSLGSVGRRSALRASQRERELLHVRDGDPALVARHDSTNHPADLLRDRELARRALARLRDAPRPQRQCLRRPASGRPGQGPDRGAALPHGRPHQPALDAPWGLVPRGERAGRERVLPRWSTRRGFPARRCTSTWSRATRACTSRWSLVGRGLAARPGRLEGRRRDPGDGRCSLSSSRAAAEPLGPYLALSPDGSRLLG